MATTNAEARGGRRREQRTPTTLDSDVTRPQITQPGDAPFDTTDPTERATSVEPDKAAAARGGFGSVNAVVPLPEPERLPGEDHDDRVESYKVHGPDGKLVDVTHNLDTGETKVG